MNVLIEIIRVLVPLLIILILVAALTEKKLFIEKSIRIDKPKTLVFDYLKLIQNHSHFSVWMMMDPDMKKEYKGTDGELGFVYSWDSAVKNVGAGEQEIIAINPSEEIQYELRFLRPRKDISLSSFRTESISENETKVTWTFHGQMKFPSNILKPFFKSILGKQLDKGLHNLKVELDKT